MNPVFEREFVGKLVQRFEEKTNLIQVLIGPRQVGKTTGVKQLIKKVKLNTHYASADDLLTSDRNWLIEQWQKALMRGEGTLLIIDEIQKIINWQETIKALWDKQPGRLNVLLLGSSAMQIQTEVTESLAGRFELTRVFHWTFHELQMAFDYTLERYLNFGGYPGSVEFEKDYDRWYSYMKDSIVEAAIGKDILSNRKVTNPALFRQAFEILCGYPAQEISYTKLLGQLQDRGNTELIKYYLELYSSAFLIYSIHKYSLKHWLSKTSSPKVLPGCPSLYSMTVRKTPENKGRIFELAVGAELLQLPGELFYWRERNHEVDYVYQYRDSIYAIEVKSGIKKSSKGLEAFSKIEPSALRVIITLENFPQFSENPRDFLRRIAI